MIYVLYAWILLGGLFGGIVQIIFAMDTSYTIDNPSIADAFYFATNFYETYKDKINCVGLAIVITFISVLVLPGSILIIVLFTLKLLGLKMWKIFMHVFRKRNKTNE